MIKLYDVSSEAEIGQITESQLQFLIDQLEEEGPEDQDYYINRPTLESFRDAGADQELLDLLKGALGGREDMDIKWSREEA